MMRAPGLWAGTIIVLTALSLGSCARLGFKRHPGAGCHEPQVTEKLGNNAPLRVTPGLDLPDTRNAVKVPELNEPEKPRSKTDPCLTRPPSFGS